MSKKALRELLEKVELGAWPGVGSSAAAPKPFKVLDPNEPDLRAVPLSALAWNAYYGSLDAAKALHEALLPGWEWSTAVDAHGERWFVVGDGGVFETDEIYGDHPESRLWLIAILRAHLLRGEN